MVNTLKKILVFLSAVLLPFSGALAADSFRVPAWVEGLSVNDMVSPNPHESTCIALAVYYEARGESIRGQRAVASVIVNRAKSGLFPTTACGVVFQPKQFSFIKGRPLNPVGPSWSNAVKIGQDFADLKNSEVPYLYFDSTGGTRGARIGNHRFR